MFSTWTFIVFTIAVCLAYWLCPPRFRAYILTAASFLYFFYFYREATIFLLIVAVAVFLWGLALKNSIKLQKVILTTGVVLLVGILGYFKYAAFVAENINRILSLFHLHRMTSIEAAIFIPLGISYFTFKMIHYLIDLKKGSIPSHRAIDFFNYIFFFPILTAGPIERFQPFLKQSKTNNQFHLENVYIALPRIASGFFKKLVIAEPLALLAAYLQHPDLTIWQYWVASLAFTLQIYFDFSGYSDIAIGISRLFGYEIMENFNWPYLSRNVSDFWKRWHMSLTAWFRDYLFIPLGGSRTAFGIIILNTFIVMAVTGLWHGAGWHFVMWGLYHACGLVALRLYRKYLKTSVSKWINLKSQLVAGFNVLITFLFVNIGWVFFACSATQSLYVVRHMAGL